MNSLLLHMIQQLNSKTLNNLCELYDIVLIQEHWLLPFELGLLNNIHDDFIGIGVSAVDITSDLLKGRPYGGTAILYNKALVSGTMSLTVMNHVCVPSVLILIMAQY